MGWYGIVDFFSTSYAEGQRKKYEKLVSYLSSKIPSIEQEINEYNTRRKAIREQFDKEPESAEGLIKDTLESKADVWGTKVEGVATQFESALSDIRNKKSQAESKVIYWEYQCKLEDERKQEYRPD